MLFINSSKVLKIGASPKGETKLVGQILERKCLRQSKTGNAYMRLSLTLPIILKSQPMQKWDKSAH